ncbi:MAG: hypothetical protein K2O44_01800 [Clostridia bacterium]|nr:hypothetical protein [Clostridia bacterium]
MSQPKIKHNRVPMIVLLCFTAIFIIAAALCFLIPMLSPKQECPVEVSETIRIQRHSAYEYDLVGKIKNTSDSEVVIKNYNGLRVYFSGSDDVAKEWLEDEDYIRIPAGGSFDLAEGTYYFTADGVKVTRVTVEIDGITYNLVGGNSTPTVIAVICGIFALIFLILAFTQDKNQRNIALRQQAALDMCSGNGTQCYIVTVNVADKDEKKKAAAKNAGWIIGGVLSALITGRGVISVSSGSSNMEFVLSENSLHAIKSDSAPATPQVTPVTRNDLTVASIETKKNKVIVKSADGKQTLTFFHDKKSPLTVEQIAEYLNNIFVKPVPQPEAVAADTGAAPEVDPFADLAPEKAETPAATDVTDKTDGE